MNDEQRAKLKFATLKLMDTSYRSGWLSDQVIGLDNPEEYKLKIKYLGRSISGRKEAEEEIWNLVEEILREIINNLTVNLPFLSEDPELEESEKDYNEPVLYNALGKISEMDGAACRFGDHTSCTIDDPICIMMVARRALRDWHESQPMKGVSTDEENLITLGHPDDPQAPPLTYRDAPAVDDPQSSIATDRPEPPFRAHRDASAKPETDRDSDKKNINLIRKETHYMPPDSDNPEDL